jgi:hypothetical protein
VRGIFGPKREVTGGCRKLHSEGHLNNETGGTCSMHGEL